jgi:hypothetical protein
VKTEHLTPVENCAARRSYAASRLAAGDVTGIVVVDDLNRVLHRLVEFVIALRQVRCNSPVRWFVPPLRRDADGCPAAAVPYGVGLLREDPRGGKGKAMRRYLLAGLVGVLVVAAGTPAFGESPASPGSDGVVVARATVNHDPSNPFHFIAHDPESGLTAMVPFKEGFPADAPYEDWPWDTNMLLVWGVSIRLPGAAGWDPGCPPDDPECSLYGYDRWVFRGDGVPVWVWNGPADEVLDALFGYDADWLTAHLVGVGDARVPWQGAVTNVGGDPSTGLEVSHLSAHGAMDGRQGQLVIGSQLVFTFNEATGEGWVRAVRLSIRIH